MNALAATITAGDTAVPLYLPYVAGERCPIEDPYARGAFVGITMTSTAAHSHKAVFEGVAMAYRSLVELLEREEEAGESRAGGERREGASDPNELKSRELESKEVKPALALVGGGSKSGVWPQIMADVLGRVITVATPGREDDSSGDTFAMDPAVSGAAILAGMGLQLEGDTGSGDSTGSVGTSDSLNSTSFTPSTAAVDHYNQLYPVWRGAYEGLKGTFRELARARGGD
jgi:xylulokinase